MQAQMFSDPNMAMDMMKKNLSMIIPQTLTFAWVNFFFSGFVAAKIPFPLTQRFRAMLQNGIDLSSVAALATDDTQRLMQTQMAMQMGGLGADPAKPLGAEKDGLELVQNEWVLPRVEQRAEAVLKQLLEKPDFSI
ncbi:unnamed protein product [Calypogeia fissa]